MSYFWFQKKKTAIRKSCENCEHYLGRQYLHRFYNGLSECSIKRCLFHSDHVRLAQPNFTNWRIKLNWTLLIIVLGDYGWHFHADPMLFNGQFTSLILLGFVVFFFVWRLYVFARLNEFKHELRRLNSIMKGYQSSHN